MSLIEHVFLWQNHWLNRIGTYTHFGVCRGNLQWRLLWLIGDNLSRRLDIMYSVIVRVCVCACVLCATTCVFLPLCLCGAFIHVPPVTSSPVWTVNTGKFEVEVHESLCWLSPSLSTLSNQGVRGAQEGRKRISFSLILLFSLLFLFSQSWSSRRGGRKERCGAAASVLWLLASASWLICLLAIFELHYTWDLHWFPPRCKMEHINIKHAAWKLQAECH